MSTDCSAFATNAGCTGMVCITNWANANIAQFARETYCQPLPGQYASCGTICGVTKWGNECCSATDWQTCFANLAKKGCAGSGTSGATGTQSFGLTSIMSTQSSTSRATATSASSVGAQVTSSSTTSSSPTVTSQSFAVRSISRGSMLTAYLFVASFLVNFMV